MYCHGIAHRGSESIHHRVHHWGVEMSVLFLIHFLIIRGLDKMIMKYKLNLENTMIAEMSGILKDSRVKTEKSTQPEAQRIG